MVWERCSYLFYFQFLYCFVGILANRHIHSQQTLIIRKVKLISVLQITFNLLCFRILEIILVIIDFNL